MIGPQWRQVIFPVLLILWMLLAFLAILLRWYYITKMKKALGSLQDRYEPIVELSNQLFYDYDVESGKISWTGAIFRVTGYLFEEFQSVNISKWTDMIHPEDLQDAIDLLEQARIDVRNYRVEYRFRQKDGKYTYVEDEGLFFPDEGGRAVRMLGTMKDISDRKESERLLQRAHTELQRLNTELEGRVRKRTFELTRANEQLQKSEERFRAIFQYVSIGMCLTSIDGRYLMVNRSLCTMLGYSEKELLTKSYRDLTDPADVKKSQMKLERLFNGETGTESYEKRYRHKNGQTVWAMVGTYLLHDSNGQPQHYIAYIQDITRRKQDEDKFQRLYAAMEQTGDAIIITNQLGIIEYVNPAFGAISGHMPPEVIGQTPQFLNSRLHNNGFYAEILSTIKAGQMWTGQITNLKKDGKALLLEASISPIHGVNEQKYGYVAVIRDVTEKQRLENRLFQAQKMEAIGTLAGGIAHDFNNILGGIIGCSELALSDVPPQSQAYSDLEKILEAGLRAKSLIKQILTFSRQGECEMVPIVLNTILKETMKLLSVSFPPNIELRIEAPQGLGTIIADPVQMQQVLMNLCTNSLYAMKDQGGILKVSLARTSIDEENALNQRGVMPDDYLRLTVSDTGRGIPEEIIERIFDPFFTTKKAGEGTGLGLSVVHGIIKKHFGTIIVDSQLGKGATFSVFIPLFQEDDVEVHEQDAELLHGGNERILIVDDEALVYDVLPRLLGGLGYQTVAKTSGADAFEIFKDQPESFDLVLTDQTMSDMTGIELARQITQVRPDIPIILCTGFSEPLLPDEARRMGIFTVLHKPIVRSELDKAIRCGLSDKSTLSKNTYAYGGASG
jgi:PAS domain S-box-containing protein